MQLALGRARKADDNSRQLDAAIDLTTANLAFVTFARMLHDIGGQVLVFFVLVVAAAEVVVGLGIVVAIFRRRSTANADDLHLMKG